MTPKEIASIKSSASDYAKRFLAHKYSLEYSELYEAYCNNRGVDTRGSHRVAPIDERIVKAPQPGDLQDAGIEDESA